MMRAGGLGALAAFTAFTLPSALVLLAFAMTAASISGPIGTGALDGLKIVAVAIVSQDVWGMAKNLCPDRERTAIAGGAVAVLPGAFGMVGAILLGALAGLPRRCGNRPTSASTSTLDPAFAPGADTPEVSGLKSAQVLWIRGD
jgi:chromate transporter